MTDYKTPALTVDVVIFCLREQRLQTLLIKRGVEPYSGKWAIPGGYVRYGEDIDAAALRELGEETGVHNIYLEQLYTFGAPDRDPRGHTVTVTYFALIPDENITIEAGTDATDAAWHVLDELPDVAFDHKEIIGYAHERLRYKLEYTSAGFKLLPREFTLTELQTAYEIVLGEKLDKRNFRRRLLEADVLEKTGQYRSGGEGRPAMLYRYHAKADPQVKARRLYP